MLPAGLCAVVVVGWRAGGLRKDGRGAEQQYEGCGEFQRKSPDKQF